MSFTIHLLSPHENKDFILELSNAIEPSTSLYADCCYFLYIFLWYRGEAMQGNMASQHLLDSLHCRMALMGTHKHFLMMTT